MKQYRLSLILFIAFSTACQEQDRGLTPVIADQSRDSLAAVNQATRYSPLWHRRVSMPRAQEAHGSLVIEPWQFQRHPIHDLDHFYLFRQQLGLSQRALKRWEPRFPIPPTASQSDVLRKVAQFHWFGDSGPSSKFWAEIARSLSDLQLPPFASSQDLKVTTATVTNISDHSVLIVIRQRTRYYPSIWVDWLQPTESRSRNLDGFPCQMLYPIGVPIVP